MKEIIPPAQGHMRCVTISRMSTNDLLKLIDAEIATLKQARYALTGKIVEKIVRGRMAAQQWQEADEWKVK
jgi:hypothetical protein